MYVVVQVGGVRVRKGKGYKCDLVLAANVMPNWVGRRSYDLQVVGSGWAPLRSGLRQATYTCVPLSPSSIIWYRPRRVIWGRIQREAQAPLDRGPSGK